MLERSIVLRLGIFLLLIASLVLSFGPPSISAQDTGDETLLGLRPVADGLEMPTDVIAAGDGSGRLFVVERAGVVRIIQDGEVLAEPFLDIRDKVISGEGELGMFSIAFHPDFATNGWFFVYYTAQPDMANTVERYVVSDEPNRADPESGRVVLAIPTNYNTHNGGGMSFGPDGYLYIGTGDGGGFRDPDANAQNRQRLLGKILRLDVNVPEPNGKPYTIPPDNPFVDDLGALPEIWAYGVRNPWRLTFDRETGDLYIGDVGDGAWEEVNYQPAGDPGGQNYGWPMTEGFACFPPDGGSTPCDIDGVAFPAFVYGHDEGCSIAGGYVYRGQESPHAQGRYLYADWCSGRIWWAKKTAAGEWEIIRLLDTTMQITGFGEDEAGELYLVDMTGGAVHRMVFYRRDAALRVTSIEPAGANAGDPAFTLTVRGEGFSEDAVVQWAGQDQPTTFVSDTELQADIPAELLNGNLDANAANQVEIRVAMPGNDPRISNAVTFTITAFADEAFRRTWSRTDAPVADEEISRTWMWGPQPVSGPLMEPYAESPGGERLVQYFDKSRMEITDPDDDPNSVWYVTNGLLVTEMVHGRIQVSSIHFEEREPAEVVVAGDLDDAAGPTYATFANLLDPVEVRRDEPVIERLDRAGNVTEDVSLGNEEVRNLYYDDITGHNIPEPFWNFMVSSGLVLVDGELVEDRLFINPFYATGRPISEAYWADVKVAGEQRLVLMQCFERRCLTYTPDNPEGWQVEAGNVGRHYYEWRYLQAPEAPPAEEEEDVRTIEVDMVDNRFDPDVIELQPGETVEFVARSIDTFHTLTIKSSADADDELFNLDVPGGERRSGRFTAPDVPGELYLYCKPHELLGMVGTVVVQ